MSNAPKRSVDDPGEFNQIRELEHIHSARQLVSDTRVNIGEGLLNGLSESRANRAYYSAVNDFVTELSPMLMNDELGFAGQYWDDLELGEIRLEPPAEASEFFENNMSQLVPGTSRPEPQGRTVVGLKEFRELDPVHRASWRFALQRKRGFDHEEFAREAAVPRSITDKAYTGCLQFLRDAGLGAKLSDVREVKEVEWGDTLDEGN